MSKNKPGQQAGDQKSVPDMPENKWQKFAQDQSVEEESIEQPMEESANQNGPEDEIDAQSDKQARDRLIRLEKEVALYQEQAFRAQAELENVRRRLENDVTKAHKFGAEKLVSELLPVIDSLVRALEGVSGDDPAFQSMREGLELTLDMFHKALEKHGVEMISPEIGAAFDPEEQEAMSMMPSPEAKSNTVLQVLQKGYKLNGRVVRAAMVIVAQ